MSRNYGNGCVPHVGKWDGMERCARCGTGIVWIKTARRRIPFESMFGEYLHDHPQRGRFISPRLAESLTPPNPNRPAECHGGDYLEATMPRCPLYVLMILVIDALCVVSLARTALDIWRLL